MHRCLRIPEVVHQIVGFTIPSHDRRSASVYWYHVDPSINRDLAALARTSRVFLEPSLDRLWRDLATLIPVWTVLGVPLECKAQYGRYTQHGHYSTSAPVDCIEIIKRANLDRLRYYLPRVRNLRVHQDSTHLSMIIALRNRLSEYGSLLFPNLLDLACDIMDHQEYCLECPMFCGPNVVRLALRPERPTFIRQILASCPGMKDLEIEESSVGFDDDDGLDISNAVLMLPMTMRSFSCEQNCSLDLQANTRLSTMSCLRELSVGRIAHGNIPFPLLDRRTPFFPALLRLEVLLTTLGPFTAMLLALDNPKLLWSLKVGYRPSTVSNSVISKFIQAISTRCDPAKLSYLNLRPAFIEEEFETTEPLPLAFSLLQPLFPFRCLQLCKIVLPRILCDDDLLESMSSAWPNLEELTLVSYAQYQEESRLTLRGLASLAKGIPNLTSLALNLQPTKNESCLDCLTRTWDYGEGPRSESMRMWLGGLDKVAAGKAPEVAAYLKTIFPGVSHVSDGRVNYWLHREIHVVGEDAYVRTFFPAYFPHMDYYAWWHENI